MKEFMKEFIVGKASARLIVETFRSWDEARAFIRGVEWCYNRLLANNHCPLGVYTREEWNGLLEGL